MFADSAGAGREPCMNGSSPRFARRNTAGYASLTRCAPYGAEHQWRKIPPRQLSVELVAGKRLVQVTGGLEPCDKGRRGRSSDPAGRNASEARAGLERAPWMPTRLGYGEGPCGMGKQPIQAPVLIHRGSWARHVGRVFRAIGGDPFGWRQAPSTSRSAWRPARESERIMVPVKPGNAGGGKGPCFWCAFRSGRGQGDWR